MKLARFARPNFSVSHIATGETISLPVAINVGILCGEFMPMLAVSLAGIYRGYPNSTQDIFSMRHWFYMIGVHTRRIAAQMIEDKPIRYLSDALLVHPSVSELDISADDTSPVSVRAHRPLPNPARRVVTKILFAITRLRVPSTVVAVNKSQRVAFDVAATGICFHGDSRSLTAAAVTKTVGNFWGRILVHRKLLTCGDMAEAVSAALGFSFPQFYPIPPGLSTSLHRRGSR